MAPSKSPAKPAATGDSSAASETAQLINRHSIRPTRWHQFLSFVSRMATWAVALAMLTLIGLRLTWHDGNNLLICLNSFTFYAYLPAYILLGLALLRKKRALSAALLVVIGFHFAWCFSMAAGPRSLVTASPNNSNQQIIKEPAKLRVFFANVYGQNKNFDAMFDEIDAANPDVIVFVEFASYWHQAARKQSNRLKLYPYKTKVPNEWADAPMVYSKYPLEKVRYVGFGRYVLEMDVHLPGPLETSKQIDSKTRKVRVVAIHAPQPLRSGNKQITNYWKRVIPWVHQQPEPLIVVGDMNMTKHAKNYADLTADKLRSSHEEAGRWFVTTWPNGRAPIPPIHIDHALISAGVECTNITEGIGHGSDHKPLILDLLIEAPVQPNEVD